MRISTKDALLALRENGKEQAFFIGRWFKEAAKGIGNAVKEAANQASRIEDEGHMLPAHEEKESA